MRTTTIQEIINLLRLRRPNAGPDWERKVPLMAKKLEEALYAKASSFEEYADHTTLRQRLQILAMELGNLSGQNRRRAITEPTPPPLARDPPPADHTMTGNEDSEEVVHSPKRVRTIAPSSPSETLQAILRHYECAICYELMAYTHSLAPCGDCFCYGCIDTWVHRSNGRSCPKCRSSFNLRNAVPSRIIDETIREALKDDHEQLDLWEERLERGRRAKKISLTRPRNGIRAGHTQSYPSLPRNNGFLNLNLPPPQPAQPLTFLSTVHGLDTPPVATSAPARTSGVIGVDDASEDAINVENNSSFH